MAIEKDPKDIAIEAIDEWFGDKIKGLCSVMYSACISETSAEQRSETSKGYDLAVSTRDIMRQIIK